MGNIVEHIIDHKKLGTPETDADGNLLAHVTLRNDTINGLLAVYDAGDGEAAITNDQPAIIVYEGDPVARGLAHYRGNDIGSIVGSFSTAAPMTSGDELLLNVQIDTLGLGDDANDRLSLPGLKTKDGDFTSVANLSMDISVSFAAPASSGTYWRIMAQVFILGSWQTIGETTMPLLAGITNVQNVHLEINAASTAYAYEPMRFIVEHDLNLFLPANSKYSGTYKDYSKSLNLTAG